MVSTVKKSDKDQEVRSAYITSSPVLNDLLLPAKLYLLKVVHNLTKQHLQPGTKYLSLQVNEGCFLLRTHRIGLSLKL